jgi:hypothetical protein
MIYSDFFFSELENFEIFKKYLKFTLKIVINLSKSVWVEARELKFA